MIFIGSPWSTLSFSSLFKIEQENKIKIKKEFHIVVFAIENASN
jgi:hypothetical protein